MKFERVKKILNRVVTENTNNPHGLGPIEPDNFAPFPKNPTIAKFFIQLGRVDVLGSGVLNAFNLISKYTENGRAQFKEKAAFKVIIPIHFEGLNKELNKNEGLNEELSEGLNKGLKSFCRIIRNIPEIQTKDISFNR